MTLSKCHNLLLVLLLSLWVALPAAAAGNWSMFKGDPSRNGRVSEPLPTALELSQTFKVPATATASPVIQDDLLLLATDTGVLYAFSLTDGTLAWLYPTGGAIRSTPIITEDSVYFLSMDDHFYALDSSNGLLKWRFKTGGEKAFAAYNYVNVKAEHPVTDPWDLFQSSPVVNDDLVIFGSSDQHLYALDRESGEVQWAYRTGGEVHSSPAISGDTVYVGSWDGALYALALNSGELQWKYATETEQEYNVWRGIQSSPVVVDDTVFIGSRDGYMYALERDSGAMQWRYDMQRSWVVPTPSVDDDHVYLGTSDGGLFLALDRQSGEEQYRVSTRVWTYSSPLVFDNAVVVGSMAGELLMIEPKSGDVLWRYEHGAMVDDRFQILDPESGRFRYDLLNGSSHDSLYGQIARVLSSGGFLASPAWSEDRLIWLTTDGTVLVFTAQND
ncbi:PQQ-binding-like beta-propeller repeat protein [Aliidiomarina sp. Khilg15.8]